MRREGNRHPQTRVAARTNGNSDYGSSVICFRVPAATKMRLASPALACAAALWSLVACAGTQVERWDRLDNGRAADVSEMSDCRILARHQAELRYPHQPIDQTFQRPNVDDADRLHAEIALFEACMQRKGFARVVVPANPRAS